MEKRILVVKNCTPHVITVVREDGSELHYEPCGIVPRVTMTSRVIGDVNDVPLRIHEPGAITGLPPYERWTMLIVSRIVAEAAPERDDLIIPDGTVRDSKGNHVGCSGFAQIPAPEHCHGCS